MVHEVKVKVKIKHLFNNYPKCINKNTTYNMKLNNTIT
jgi:hypothetical protein